MDCFKVYLDKNVAINFTELRAVSLADDNRKMGLQIVVDKLTGQIKKGMACFLYLKTTVLYGKIRTIKTGTKTVDLDVSVEPL
jgi:hypothetical protein